MKVNELEKFGAKLEMPKEALKKQGKIMLHALRKRFGILGMLGIFKDTWVNQRRLRRDYPATRQKAAGISDAIEKELFAAYGISAGGYLVPRAATAENRIRACVASSAILNFHEVWTRNTSLARLAQWEGSLLMGLIKKLPLKKVETVSRLVSTYCWRWGVNSVTDLLEVSKSMVFEPKEITCPVLGLIGAQEYEKFEASREWAHRFVEEANTSRKTLIVTPRDEGADSHAIGTNLSLMAQTVFDWLDETFANPAADEVHEFSTQGTQNGV